jgi:putative CocE/NonD family hydrolase
MIDFYEDSRNLAAPTVQDEQWLLVGPWVHGGTGIAYVGSSIQGELNYPNAEYVSDTMAWNFFLYYLLDTPNNWQNTDKITYYEMGLDQWSSSNNTNIAASSTDVLYLDGLSLIPQNGTGSSSFISDPSNPSPTIGGATLHTTLDQGPYDQSSLEGRSDIVTFSTQVLSSDVSISGRVKLQLYLESDQPDCDIVVRLVDVYDNGDNMLITDGIKRLRFRNGYQQVDESIMSPGAIYNVDLDLPFTNYTWMSGHQIKIYLSGNSSYRWDVNLQNGGTMYVAGDTIVATITIHHDAANPSRIVLPGSNPVLSNDKVTNSSVSIYPNPAMGQLFIEAESIIYAVIINDMTGRTLFISSLHPKEINIAKYLPGMYLVSLKTKDGWVKKRFIKY